MEEYVSEAPQTGSVSNRLEYEEREESPQKHDEPEPDESKQKQEDAAEEKPEDEPQEPEPEPETQPEPPLISTDDDLLGLQEINPKAAELEESNALALAIIQPGKENHSSSLALTEFGTSGWELALVTTPSNINNAPPPDTKLAGGFDKLLLDSLYEDDNARRQLQLQNAGYGPYGMEADPMQVHNPFEQQQDPFYMSNTFAPPTNVQLAMLAQQQQQHHLMTMQQEQQQSQMMMVPYQNASPPQTMGMGTSSPNPFGDPFNVYPQNTTPQHGNHGLL